MSEDDDFGDFQTCQISDTMTPNNKNEVEILNDLCGKSNVNIFDLNSNDFTQALNYFDGIICESFPLDKRTNQTVIHSQEDSITDCP